MARRRTELVTRPAREEAAEMPSAFSVALKPGSSVIGAMKHRLTAIASLTAARVRGATASAVDAVRAMLG